MALFFLLNTILHQATSIKKSQRFYIRFFLVNPCWKPPKINRMVTNYFICPCLSLNSVINWFIIFFHLIISMRLFVYLFEPHFELSFSSTSRNMDQSNDCFSVCKVLPFSVNILKVLFYLLFGCVTRVFSFNPANIYLFKVNNRNPRKRCGICLKFKIKAPERRHWCRSGVFIFKHISYLFLGFLLLTVNK